MKVKYVGKNVDALQRKSRRHNASQISEDEIRDNHSLFRLLNEKDRDILYLIFVSKKKQQAVRKIMGRTQPSLCYDIKRIRERIQFIVYLKQVFDIFLDFIENKAKDYPVEMMEILVLMYYTTSFTTTANVLNKPQIFVRYMFEKALRRIRELRHWEVYEIFSTIGNNKNKIRRVYQTRLQG